MLKDVFDEDKKPLWRIYHGRGERGSVIGKNMDDKDMESSWEKLENRLERYGDGIYTVALMGTASTNNKGATLHTVKIGAGDNHPSHPTGGLNGMKETLTLLEFLEKRDSRSIGDVMGDLEDKMEMQWQLRQLREENRLLKRRGQFDKLAEIAMDKLPKILEHYYPQTNVSGMLGTLGTKSITAARARRKPHDTDGDDDKPMKGSGHNVDFNVVVNAAVKLQATGENVNEVLISLVNLALTMKREIPEASVVASCRKLQGFLRNNPGMAKSVLLTKPSDEEE